MVLHILLFVNFSECHLFSRAFKYPFKIYIKQIVIFPFCFRCKYHLKPNSQYYFCAGVLLNIQSFIRSCLLFQTLMTSMPKRRRLPPCWPRQPCTQQTTMLVVTPGRPLPSQGPAKSKNVLFKGKRFSEIGKGGGGGGLNYFCAHIH